jgi:hypothetical protein
MQALGRPSQASRANREFALASYIAEIRVSAVDAGERATTRKRAVASGLRYPHRRQHLGMAEVLPRTVRAPLSQRARSRQVHASLQSRAPSVVCEQARGPRSKASWNAQSRVLRTPLLLKGPRAGGQAQQVVRDGRTSASAWRLLFLCAAQLRR